MNPQRTRNQQRALALAQQLLAGDAEPTALSDSDWQLLLLAAGLNGARIKGAAFVAERVADHARRHVGYFTPHGPQSQLDQRSTDESHRHQDASGA